MYPRTIPIRDTDFRMVLTDQLSAEAWERHEPRVHHLGAFLNEFKRRLGPGGTPLRLVQLASWDGTRFIIRIQATTGMPIADVTVDGPSGHVVYMYLHGTAFKEELRPLVLQRRRGR
ncbi:hypothetical protein FQN57_004919 [Myotisia sp. PD_48]|nr:hypothetical protein FQN57_004919 [Myotisia sp. PD_48]